MPARMFAAIVPPPRVLEDLDEFLAPRRDADPAVSWTKPASWHLTTAFMAAVPDRTLEALIDGLTGAAARTAPFDVTLRGAGAFPNPYAARLLYLAAEDAADNLTRLARRCRTAADRAGVAVDGARFVPHLTVARARRPIEATRWLRILDAHQGITFESDQLLLIESHLRDPGRRYEVVAILPLGPAQSARPPRAAEPTP